MKKLLPALLFLVSFTSAFSQGVRSYTSTSGEMIFSFAKITDKGSRESSNLRWSPVFNLQLLRNHDFTDHIGLFYGAAIRNVGFIYETPNTDTMHKYRTYNIGIPVGLKIGKLSGFFLYGGYELEMPFHYKEKLFINEKKEDKTSIWFSNRVPDLMHAAFIGLNFKRGFNLKFKYYFTPFFNKNATETINNVQTRPFQNLDVNVFYIALDWNMFRDVKQARKSKKDKPRDNSQYSYRY